VSNTTWQELFPDGRYLVYEGEDPVWFVAAIEREFGFDPSADPAWGKDWLSGDPRNPDPFGRSLWFHCPAAHLQAIYGTSQRDPFNCGS